MPPASSNAGGSRGGSGDEILGAAGDEIKVFKDEGENEEEQGVSESLHADLLGEAETKGLWKLPQPSYSLPAFHQQALSMGYLMNPYGALAAAGGLSPFLPIGSPPLQGGPPTSESVAMAQAQAVQAQAAAAFRGHAFPYGLPYPGAGLGHLGWPPSMPPSVSPGGGPGHHGMPPPLHHLPPLPNGAHPHNPFAQQHSQQDMKNAPQPEKKEPHVKKPLNAFMIYMKEQRPVVQAECTLKESAAINQILGRRWHALSKEEQGSYYERAREEKARHAKQFPNWSPRESYRQGPKKKKRKIDKEDPTYTMKKCRARYGLEQQQLWCKPCRRKKKCVRVQMYLQGRSIQEIEATRFDQEGKTLAPNGQFEVEGGGEEEDDDEDGEQDENSPHNAKAALESSLSSIGSPSPSLKSLPSPDQGPSSLSSAGSPGILAPPFSPSLAPSSSMAPPFSPASLSSPSPHSGWSQGRPVGGDPRDTKNPLSISNLSSNPLSISSLVSSQNNIAPPPQYHNSHNQLHWSVS